MRNRAKTYFKQKNYPAAIKVLETALELAENMDDPTLTTQILYQLGLTYFACKLYRKCLIPIRFMSFCLKPMSFWGFESALNDSNYRCTGRLTPVMSQISTTT